MKNKMMRVAVIMMALVLVTSCFVGGTFAKYVTSDNAEDGARVAKWGVSFTMTKDPLFSAEYDTHDGDYSADMAISVKADEKVVAPGTSGNAVTFAVEGTPEVSYEVTLEVTDGAKTVFVKDTEGREYYPIKWTYTLGDTTGTTTSITDLVAAIEGYTFYYDVDTEAYYDADGNELTNTGITINWAWDFDDANNSGSNDVYDTLLGNIAAGTVQYDESLYNTTIWLELTATATQID